MQPFFTDEQLKNMNRENLAQVITLMQEHQTKLEAKQKILEEKVHEPEFLNALLSDKLTLAQRKQFGSSSEKYADGYTQMNLFNEAEQEADPESAEPEMEEVHPSSYKREKWAGKKDEDLSAFPTTEVIEHKLEGPDRYCLDCGRMIRPDKETPFLKGSIATLSLVAGIMNAKYVNGMPLARQ